VKVFYLFLLLSFCFAVFVNAQSLTKEDLKAGEIYYMQDHLSNTYILKYRQIYNKTMRLGPGDALTYMLMGAYIYNGADFANDEASNIYYNEGRKPLLRKATEEERNWLNACIEAGKFVSKDAPSANRGPIKSTEIALNRKALWPKVKSEGWQFSFVPFRYQFVNCGGEVQVGVQYDKKAQHISLVHNGVAYYSANAPELWPKPDQIEVGSVQAKLYYGNIYWGEVSLTYIVGNFAGCFGETFDVLKQVNKDPTAKEYRDNLDKFTLQNIAITEGGVTINYQQENEIIKKVSYDDFGNPKKPGTQTAPTPTDKPKYDVFGNPIKD